LAIYGGALKLPNFKNFLVLWTFSNCLGNRLKILYHGKMKKSARYWSKQLRTFFLSKIAKIAIFDNFDPCLGLNMASVTKKITKASLWWIKCLK
jgi:hypothetical protein